MSWLHHFCPLVILLRVDQNKCTNFYTRKETCARWVPALSGSVCSAMVLLSVVETLSCLCFGLQHQCEWMVSHMFHICLIVYLSSLFTSTHELQSAYCQNPSANEWRPPHGLALDSWSILYFVMAEDYITNERGRMRRVTGLCLLSFSMFSP